MGNISCGNREIHEDKPTCSICFEHFDKNIHTQCLNCRIYLHHECTMKYLKFKQIGYCICPYCKAIGSLCTSYVPNNVPIIISEPFTYAQH